jgi:hypothetical protein
MVILHAVCVIRPEARGRWPELLDAVTSPSRSPPLAAQLGRARVDVSHPPAAIDAMLSAVAALDE